MEKALNSAMIEERMSEIVTRKNEIVDEVASKKEEFENAVIRLYKEEILPFINDGLSASIYTQVSDVEDETNGFYTYDRQVLKVDVEKFKELFKDINK